MIDSSRNTRISIWLISGFLFFATAPGTIRAQNPQTNERSRKSAWREEPGAIGAGFARTSSALDRAIGRIHGGRLDQRTHNFGDMGTVSEGWHCCRYPRPDGSGNDSWGWDMSMALAVGPGPWFDHAQVHESAGGFQPLSRADWEAQDGARGTQFQGKWWVGGYPLFAHSHLPGTWPPGGWPAPEEIEDVWLGTQTWK
ncbi:MAG: hypothetical protein KAT18_06385, partial [Candidatus Latescibacteria bacterium]|nr:hypothetical protein [Candidatus Latescibacterota bacterium]